MSMNRIIDALIAEQTDELEIWLGPDWMSKVGQLLWESEDARSYYEGSECQT